MSLPLVTLPGIYDSGPTHWQTLWEQAQPERFRRFRPGDWDQPRLADWIAALDRAVSISEQPPVLVAHSLSCLLVPQWAATTTFQVSGAVLVAPVDPEADAFPAAAHEFGNWPRDPLAFPALVVGSHDDPYAEFAWSRAFAADLGAAFVDVGARGHVNADSGLGEWDWGRGLVDGFSAALTADC